MNSNAKNRQKTRPTNDRLVDRSHPNSSMTNNKSQMRQKPLTERPLTPDGVYLNARLMHCTTSLVGCVVQVQVKDGTRYEGVLTTFSPEFELVVDYVTKIDKNSVPIMGSNVANLLVSLQANNPVSDRIIFKFQDVVNLTAVNVDLDFAVNKGHMMTDTEISRYDANKLSRDKELKELVPWDGGHGDCDDNMDAMTLDDHNGVGTQNGWSPDEMFKVNETKFQVKSTYDPSLPDYTTPLVKGEGQEYEERQKAASELANQIENDPSRQERYAKEDADDEEKYSAVVRPNETNSQYRNQDRNRNRKSNNSPNSGLNNSGGVQSLPPRQQRPISSAAASVGSSFHAKNSNTNYSKQFPSGNSASYSNQPHKVQNYRDEQPSGYAVAGQTYAKSVDNEDSSYRSSNDSRRPAPSNKPRKEDYKPPANADTSKDRDRDSVSSKSEAQSKPTNAPTGGSCAKSKSPLSTGDAIPVKDKTSEGFASQAADEASLDNESSDQTDTTRDSIEPVSVQSPTDSTAADPEIAKKSTLNPNAKTFTPRSPMTPLNTSATPPSVASTPSSTVSVPITGNISHAAPQNLNHNQGHNHHIQVGPQQSQHTGQPRFQIPLVQNQFNVLTPGLTPLLHNQYLMATTMAPQFAQSNPNQQRPFRGKGPVGQYRQEFNPQSHHVAAAVTGHPVLASGPIGAPQQIPVSYGPQQTTMVTPQVAQQQTMYQHMYQYPRMNVLPQHSGPMQMAGIPQAVQYDPTQLQHIYNVGTVNAVQLQHLVSQAHQQAHLTNSGPHSGHSTPQSATPTTPLHGGPAPSPVHHQPNQPPTPTPPQSVMYANVTTAHNPQNPNVGHHAASGGGYPSIIMLQQAGHHTGHGGPLHANHPLSHSSTATNHSGPHTMIAPVHMINQNQLAATFNANTGV